jgi:hypothetical protein
MEPGLQRTAFGVFLQKEQMEEDDSAEAFFEKTQRTQS